MQRTGETGRLADAAALGRGVAGFGDAFGRLEPHVVLVLGDRIEAFAAASAASVGGIVLAHIHGGDRAEGVADEAMRHAISKLAHLHFPATGESAQRLERMGEPRERIHRVGSPAIDGLAEMPALSDAELGELGISPSGPIAVLLHHPAGLAGDVERDTSAALAKATMACFGGARVLALEPNHDPGREALLQGLRDGAVGGDGGPSLHPGLPRPRFVGLLKRVAASGGLLVGNSSAGLIEAAALGCVSLTVGPRQRGRERGDSVITVSEDAPPTADDLRNVIDRALAASKQASDTRCGATHPYGDGHTGERIATTLASVDLTPALLRKCNTY
jgi:UDP-hydrolysing UDP-N-acetyl-D-glucosamine 2-epimerase